MVCQGAIWANEPISSGELVKLAEAGIAWKKSTTYTVLKKLCGKGLLQNENAVVGVLVPREAVTCQAAERFVEQTFGGSLPSFFAAFMSGKKLTEAEAEALKCLIDRHQEGAQ